MPVLDKGSAVTAEAVTKRFGSTQALDGLDLVVPAGTVCGVLGPNGAGKTTVTRVLATLVRPDSGRAVVGGFDVVREPHKVRQVIGLVGQFAAVDMKLTGRENLMLYSRLHHMNRNTARSRTQELIDRFQLEEIADRSAATYSGGQRRRLDLAASLLTTPKVLFLDEPTPGLDPMSRNQIWQHVKELAQEGTTVVLTTQYLDEADQLADRIVVVDRGKAIATGTPAEIKAEVGLRMNVVLAPGADTDAAVAALTAILDRSLVGQVRVEPGLRTVSAMLTSTNAPTLPQLLRELESRDILPEDAALRTPTLDEAFLRLTGHLPDEAGEAGEGAKAAGKTGAEAAGKNADEAADLEGTRA